MSTDLDSTQSKTVWEAKEKWRLKRCVCISTLPVLLRYVQSHELQRFVTLDQPALSIIYSRCRHLKKKTKNRNRQSCYPLYMSFHHCQCFGAIVKIEEVVTSRKWLGTLLHSTGVRNWTCSRGGHCGTGFFLSLLNRPADRGITFWKHPKSCEPLHKQLVQSRWRSIWTDEHMQSGQFSAFFSELTKYFLPLPFFLF